MSLVSFGQPDDGIIQMAYVVEDMRRAIEHWTKKLNTGPWFLLEHFTGIDARYRGRPTDVVASIAMSFAGHMMVELIEQHNDAPSVYRETIDKRGYGFHHFGVATRRYDADLKRYLESGYELAFSCKVPTGDRVGYVDTTADLPGMVELIEIGDGFEPTFNRFYGASIGWDGKDPIRAFV
jgi:hypothetical protein